MTPRFALHIDGEDRASARDAWLPVFDPCTGAPWADVAAADAADAEAAVAAAQRAAPAWAAQKPSERARWLERIADALEAEAETFVALESRDTGKPLALCREIEIPRAVANLRFFAAAARTFGSESQHGEAGLDVALGPIGAEDGVGLGQGGLDGVVSVFGVFLDRLFGEGIEGAIGHAAS